MKAFIKNINLEGDKVIWAIVLALSIFSILVVYSTAGWKFLFSHLIKLSIGLFFLYQVHKIKFKYFAKIGVLGFVVSIILLILVFIMGVTVNGASRWLSIASWLIILIKDLRICDLVNLYRQFIGGQVRYMLVEGR